jgi:hypothetical protein
MWSEELGGILLVLFSITLFGYVVRKSSFNRWNQDSSLALALNVVATVLVSYHCHVFDLCILILPLGLGVDFIRSNLPISPRVRWRLAIGMTLSELRKDQPALMPSTARAE